MTSTATLTERYIAATVKSITPTAQDDVRAELAASIDDAIEARIDQGESHHDAERAVLTELGDPAILAASYADRPLHLIGPRFYLSWWRLLKLLLMVVPPIAMVGVAIGTAVSGGDVGDVIGSMVAVGISTVVHIGFWTTLVFVILERTNSDTTLTKWDLDQLPAVQTKKVAIGDLVATIVLAVILAGSVIWDHFIGWGSDQVHVLSDSLWPGIAIGLFVCLALTIAIALGVLRAGRWTILLASLNAIIALVILVASFILIWQNDLLHPDLTALWADAGDGVRTGINVALTIVFGASVISSIPEPFVKAVRARRA